MQINNLTPYQVELLDAMWACDSMEEYDAFYATLDEEDQLLADNLQRLVIMEALDEDMAAETKFPEAEKLLDQFRIWCYNKHMKTNKDKNMEHQAKQDAKVRPKDSAYDFEPLQAVINSWIKGNV